TADHFKAEGRPRQQGRDAIPRQQRRVGFHAARGLEEGVNNPVEPDRHAQNKKPVGSIDRIDGGVAKERGEDCGRAAAAVSVLINAHFWSLSGIFQKIFSLYSFYSLLVVASICPAAGRLQLA